MIALLINNHMQADNSKWVIALTVLLGLAGTAMADDSRWETRLRTDAPKIWAEYRQKTQQDSMQFIKKQWSRRLPGEFPPAPTEVMVKKRNPSGTRLLLMHDNLSLPSCWGINEKYAFQLTRNKYQEPWIISNIVTDLTKTTELSAMFYPLRVGEGGLQIGPPNELYDYGDLERLIGESGFKVLKVAGNSRDGHELIRFDFACSRREGDPKTAHTFHYEKGWFVVEPAATWRVCEYEASVNYPSANKATAVVHGTLDINETPQGIPVMKGSWVRVKKSVVPPAKPNAPPEQFEEEIKTEYGIERHECEPEEFTLSAFGLPEPPGVTWKRPTPWFLWGTLAAVSLLALGTIISWLKRRLFR